MDYLFNKITGESRPLPPLPEDADADYGACGLATRYRKKHVNFYPRRKPADLLVTLVIVVATVVAFWGGGGVITLMHGLSTEPRAMYGLEGGSHPILKSYGEMEGLVQVL